MVEAADFQLVTATPAEIERIFGLWMDGLVVTPSREYRPDDVEGGLLRDADGTELAAVTWAQDGVEAEIVTLDALVRGRGYGRQALRAAEQALTACGVSDLVLFTTNDNLGAQALYLNEGYRLVAVHLDSMERVRALKPQVPAIGLHGLPLRDMWEFRKTLVGGSP